MDCRTHTRRALSAGTASVAASWLMFAGLAGVAWLVTTLDTPALIGLAVSAVSAGVGLLARWNAR